MVNVVYGIGYGIYADPKKKEAKNISTIVSQFLPKLIIIWSCVGFLALAKYGYFWSIYLDYLDTWQATRTAVNIIQTKGSVLTTSQITPHLSHRQFIKLIIEEEELPRDEALAEYDYVLINVRHPGWKSSQEYARKLVDKLKVNSEFQLSYQKDDVYLFEKDSRAKRKSKVISEVGVRVGFPTLPFSSQII
ncbi:MAG: DUF2079 domain-containing protein [Trichodesmium sp. St5_bin8]|nr:DUF2079 domain-containing protein [Trichodesmium sp. St5_bin8]